MHSDNPLSDSIMPAYADETGQYSANGISVLSSDLATYVIRNGSAGSGARILKPTDPPVVSGMQLRPIPPQHQPAPAPGLPKG
jgi:hypothetical protein